MTQTNAMRVTRLENEKRDLQCRYSSMRACQQDKVDERITKIDELLAELQAS